MIQHLENRGLLAHALGFRTGGKNVSLVCFKIKKNLKKMLVFNNLC